MNESAPAPIVVVGAGLTGLAASLHLKRAGVPHRIIERLDRPGGHATTVEEVGYRFDRTGHLLHLRDPSMRELVFSLLEPGSLVEVARKSMIWSNGVYTRYPFQANTFGLPREIAYECVLGFVEAQMKKPEHSPKNFEEFSLAHFGPGISKHFMVPYNTRLWGVHPREITATWCSRFVPLPKLEDVIAGAVGLHDRELGYNANFLYPRLGIGELVRALSDRANPVETGCAPTKISARKKTIAFADGTVPYRELVSTIPLPRLVELIDDAPAQVRDAAKKLRATPLWYLDVALNTPCEKPYHWVYVPEARYPFYRVGCYSNFSAAMAPPGKACLYVELADREKPNMAELLPRVADALVEMNLIRAREAIRFARPRLIEVAYVVFDHAYDESVATVKAYLDSVGIVTAGRYGEWVYSSMEDALIAGRDAARKVIERLGP